MGAPRWRGGAVSIPSHNVLKRRKSGSGRAGRGAEAAFLGVNFTGGVPQSLRGGWLGSGSYPPADDVMRLFAPGHLCLSLSTHVSCFWGWAVEDQGRANTQQKVTKRPAKVQTTGGVAPRSQTRIRISPTRPAYPVPAKKRGRLWIWLSGDTTIVGLRN